jgi:hypothetical protein
MVAAGDIVYAQDINERGLRYYGNRTSNAGPTSGATVLGVLRIDNMVLKAGYAYRISTGNFRLNTTVATDGIKAELRYNSTGVATISSTEIARIESDEGGLDQDSMPSLTGLVIPGTDTTVASVLMTIVRFSGTGTVSVQGDTGGLHLFVEGLGESPGDTGFDV